LPASDLSLENLEGLTEKVGTLGLQTTRKRRCGAGQYQFEQRAGETPLIGEEHLPVSRRGMGEAPFFFWG
jgi:hypothetical protein